MNVFYGKAYRYKDKVIGVCNTLREGLYMIGHATTGGHKRVKALSLFDSVEESQKTLDDFAAARGIDENTANARLIAAAPEMYRLLDRTHRILYRFKVEGIIDVVDLAKLVKETALLLNSVDGTEANHG